MSKLNKGSIIEVHGWVMLAGVEGDRQYRISSVDSYHGKDVYRLVKHPRGKKVIVSHYAKDVDLWIGNPRNNNRIDIISQ